jgi:hypothetical protein
MPFSDLVLTALEAAVPADVLDHPVRDAPVTEPLGGGVMEAMD